MLYEEKLKKLLDNVNTDPYWFATIKNFIEATYEDMEKGVEDLENLAKDRAKFNEFTKQLIQRKNDLKDIKDEFLGPQNNNIHQVSANIARMINYKTHAEKLYIPVLNGFNIENDDNPQTILLATRNGYIEQLTSDGYIANDTFKERIDFVINNTKQFMKNSGCENADNSFIFYKDYNNGIFNFKIYVCDIIINNSGEKKAIRQFIAYFIEEQMHDFYQMSLSAGPFIMPTQMLKTGILDLHNDQVTISLDNLMKILLDNLKYKS